MFTGGKEGPPSCGINLATAIAPPASWCLSGGYGTNQHTPIRLWDVTINLKRRELRLREEKSESQRQKGQFILYLPCVISKRISWIPTF